MTDQLKQAISAAQTAQTRVEKTERTDASNIDGSAGEQHFDVSESSYKTSHTAVRKARRFAMQGLYEWLVTDRRFDSTGNFGWKDNAPNDIAARTRATNAMHTVHIGYYHEMMRDIPEQIEVLDALISQHLDRDISKLDTVEHAILLIGAYELQNRIEIPYKVVLDEAMKLNNHFGATDAHKLINAVLDRMAVELRAIEVQADTKASLRTSQKTANKVVAEPLNAEDSVTKTDDNVEAKADNAKPSTDSKPRISANKTNVKRNRPNKTATRQAIADVSIKSAMVAENTAAVTDTAKADADTSAQVKTAETQDLAASSTPIDNKE